MSTAVIITVSLKDSRSNPPKLKLKDSEGHVRNDDQLTTGVDTGATVTWVPDLSSGISQLMGIVKKTSVTKNNNTLLQSDPTESNGNYVGTIVSTSPGKGKVEFYQIGFKIDGDDTVYWDDPKLQMNN